MKKFWVLPLRGGTPFLEPRGHASVLQLLTAGTSVGASHSRLRKWTTAFSPPFPLTPQASTLDVTLLADPSLD